MRLGAITEKETANMYRNRLGLTHWVYEIILLLSLFGAAPSNAQPGEKIVIATTGGSGGSIFDTPLLYGFEKGLFRKEGIELHFREMAGNLYIAALLAKEVDFIANVGTPFRAAVTGLPIKVLAVSMSKPLFYILAQPNIRSPKELIGKKFALSSSQGTSARAAKAGLRSLGLDPNKDLTFIVIGLASIRMAAMEAGSVEATVLSSPSNIRMRQKGFKELIFAGKDLSEPVMGIATSNEKIEKTPNQVKNVLKALMRSVWAVKHDQKEVTNFMAQRFNLEPEVAREAYETMMLSISESGTLNPKDARNYLEEVKKETGVKKDLLVDDLLDFRLLREATKELRR